jgi:hypothetical protein
MPLNSRNSFRDARVAAEFAEMIDAESAVNEDFDKETNVYVPISETNLIKSYSIEMSEKKEPVSVAPVPSDEDEAGEIDDYEDSAEKRELSLLCEGCGVDTLEIDEYYMVQFDLWKMFVPKEIQRQVLCIGCLEGYLGRELVSEDFIEAPVNYCRSESERLMNRMGQWFRDFDGPHETPEEIHAAAKEMRKRFDGKVKRAGPKYLVRVDVDTNNIVRGGLTLARLVRVADEINVGDTVLAHDMAEEADFFATVEAVEGKRAYLKLDWDSAVPW